MRGMCVPPSWAGGLQCGLAVRGEACGDGQVGRM